MKRYPSLFESIADLSWAMVFGTETYRIDDSVLGRRLTLSSSVKNKP